MRSNKLRTKNLAPENNTTFQEPKLDKDTLSSAYMDSYTKKVMPSIRRDKRTIKDDLYMRIWNKDWRK